MNSIKVEIKVNVPSWVNWMAVDSNGECWGFSLKPEPLSGCWDCMFGDSEELYRGIRPKNWKLELYEYK